MNKEYVAIHCRTEEEAMKLFDYLRAAGIRWLSKTELLATGTDWEEYTDKTCYAREYEDFIDFDSPMDCLVYGDAVGFVTCGYTTTGFFDDPKVVDLLLGRITLWDLDHPEYAGPNLDEILGIEQ